MVLLLLLLLLLTLSAARSHSEALAPVNKQTIAFSCGSKGRASQALGPNSFNFMRLQQKKYKNCLAHPFGSWCPTSGKLWIPH